MILTEGDLWTWNEKPVVARVAPTEANRLLVETPLNNKVVEAVVRERNEMYGHHLHAFQPKSNNGRVWWLVTWPTELELKRVAQELWLFTLAQLPDYGVVVLPATLQPMQELEEVFNQQVVFATRLTADGDVVADSVESIGDRFVMVG